MYAVKLTALNKAYPQDNIQLQWNLMRPSGETSTQIMTSRLLKTVTVKQRVSMNAKLDGKMTLVKSNLSSSLIQRRA